MIESQPMIRFCLTRKANLETIPLQGRLQGLWSEQSLVNTRLARQFIMARKRSPIRCSLQVANPANDLSKETPTKFETLQVRNAPRRVTEVLRRWRRRA